MKRQITNMKYGCARIATIDQNADMQFKALQRPDAKRISPTSVLEPPPSVLASSVTSNPCKDGDTLTVWKLDRLARTLPDLIAMVKDFDKCGIHFWSLTGEINTTPPGGQFIFHIFDALVEFKCGLIIERTRQT